MLFPSATVVAAMVLSLAGVSPLPDRTAARGAASAPVRAPTKIAAGLWAPKKSKPKPAKEDDDAREEELLRGSAPAKNGGAAKPTKRRPIKMDESAEEGEDEGGEEGDEEDDEDHPRVVKKRKRVVEEEEDEAPDPIASQPAIIPRLVNFGLSTAAIRRSFAFDQAALQGDSGIRFGYQLALETFPLVTRPNGWYRTIGLGVAYEKQYGNAVHDMANGMFNGYPFSQSRLGFDLRVGIPAGEWVVIMPAIGYGKTSADLRRSTSSTPTACVAASATDPCFGDVNVSYMTVDLHIRIAVTPNFALSLAGGYLHGLSVTKGMDQITVEAAGTTMKGFHVEPSALMLINDWFAVQAAIPIRRYAYTFQPGAGTSFSYRGAGDTYIGLTAGIAVVTK